MHDSERFSLDEMAAVFSCEVVEVDGEFQRSVTQDDCLYIHALLPQVAELAPGDRVQAGIALRANRRGLAIHPYLVREQSAYGFIMARVLQAQPLLLQDYAGPELVKFAIGQAVRVCSAGDVFDYAIDRLRDARRVPAFSGGFAIDVSLMLNRTPAKQQLARILQSVSREGDDSAFGLANGISSTARDLQDPEERWQLELLAGEVAVQAARSAPVDRAPTYPERLAVQAA